MASIPTPGPSKPLGWRGDWADAEIGIRRQDGHDGGARLPSGTRGELPGVSTWQHGGTAVVLMAAGSRSEIAGVSNVCT
ncbi:MAG TPA: hypothetical protein VMV23_11310, partial [Candidatus Nanopelagicaceae bacterium]|nr:hypothetical protein [Candidatus Nanopelagicaceae bacterium]